MIVINKHATAIIMFRKNVTEDMFTSQDLFVFLCFKSRLPLAKGVDINYHNN